MTKIDKKSDYNIVLITLYFSLLLLMAKKYLFITYLSLNSNYHPPLKNFFVDFSKSQLIFIFQPLSILIPLKQIKKTF